MTHRPWTKWRRWWWAFLRAKYVKGEGFGIAWQAAWKFARAKGGIFYISRQIEREFDRQVAGM